MLTALLSTCLLLLLAPPHAPALPQSRCGQGEALITAAAGLITGQRRSGLRAVGRGTAAALEGELPVSIHSGDTAPSRATGGATAGSDGVPMEGIQAWVRWAAGCAGGWDVINEGHVAYGTTSSCRILALHHAPSLQHLQFF